MNYIMRHQKGIQINEYVEEKIIETSLRKYINEMCIKNLSTFEGRRQSTKELFGFESNIPIYVNNNIILFSTKCIRSYDTVFVNFQNVLSYKKADNMHTKFIFTNLQEKTLKVTFKKVLKQHHKIQKILEYMNNL